MAKAYSKAAKRRAKKQLPDLAPVERREKDGRQKRSLNPEYERDKSAVVYRARARHMGKPESKASEMNNPALSEDAGKAIFSARKREEAERLWAAYAGFTAAEALYAKRYLGMRLHAKTAKIEYMVEVFEARPDDRPDMRSDDEKSRDAANNWARWRGYIMCLPRYQQSLIFEIAYGRFEAMSHGEITKHGERFVDAVGALADIVYQQEKRSNS